MKRAALVVALLAVTMLGVSSNAVAVPPDPTIGADGGSQWSYQDLLDSAAKYEGGYAEFDDASTDTYSNPHGGYDTASNKCKMCHAVHRAGGAYYLLRADSQDDACNYCHVGGSAHSSKVVYDLNSAGVYTPNGHTIGASSAIPDSSRSQWTQEVELEAVDGDGNPVTETIVVRSYDEEKRQMYRFARHHGHSEATGADRYNYIPVGPLALRCMSCHQTHNSTAMTWQVPSVISNGGADDGTPAGYKLLRQFPSGTFVGGLDAHGQVPIGNISIVPESDLAAGINFDNVRALGDDPGALDLARGGTSREYNRPMWVAQSFDREGLGGLVARSNPAVVNNAALSVWCADCHNLNIGGGPQEVGPELGFKAHTERTHPVPYVGAFRGPGQCYSCHRSDLPRINNGDPCSQCHYGTGNYRENRNDPVGLEYVASDFPHSGEDSDYKLLGSYSVDVAGSNPTTIDESVTVTADNLDAVCLRCHWMVDSYHDAAAPLDHSVPSVYATCLGCHPGADVTSIHSGTASGCDACHDAAVLTNDCATCHPAQAEPDGTLIAHGYEAAMHTATPGSDYVLIYAAGEHDSVMTWDGEVLVSCSSCHRTELGPIHGDDCSTCHPAPFDTLAPSWNGSCQQGGCHTTYHTGSRTAHWPVEDQCTQCHGSGWSVSASSCANCHATYSPSDVTPPVTTSNAQASYTGVAVIDFSVSDGGKVGVGTTYFRVDGGAVSHGSRATVSAPGAHTIEFWSADQNGNLESPHKSASFTVVADTTPPVTTSNAQAAYYTPATITLTATDNGSQGVKATYYTLNGGPTQTGTSISIPRPASGTVAYALVFWSEDWSGNVEAPKSANFTVTGGTGTIRLVWGDSDFTGPPPIGSEATWTIRRGSWSGALVGAGSGAWPGWSGVNDYVFAVNPTVGYYIVVDWWDDYYGYWDQSAFANVRITSEGQVVRLSY